MTRPSTRARIDWGAARAYFVAMDPPRTRVAVARRFGVSEAAVRTHATAEEWDELARQADERAAAKALAGAVRTREQRVAATARIHDRLLDHFEANLDAKAAEASFTDLERMAKLVELLMGEATDRVSYPEAQALVGEILKLALQWVTADGSPSARRAGLMADVEQLLTGMRQLEAGGGE